MHRLVANIIARDLAYQITLTKGSSFTKEPTIVEITLPGICVSELRTRHRRLARPEMRTNCKSSAAIPPQNKHARWHTFSLSLFQRSTPGGAWLQSSPCPQHCRYACHARATCGGMLLHCTLTHCPKQTQFLQFFLPNPVQLVCQHYQKFVRTS